MLWLAALFLDLAPATIITFAKGEEIKEAIINKIISKKRNKGFNTGSQSTSSDLTLPKIEIYHLDLMSLDSVKKFSSQIIAEKRDIDILINCAGIQTGQNKVRLNTLDQVEIHFGVNYLAHFALTVLLLPTLARTSAVNNEPSRVDFNWDDMNSLASFEGYKKAYKRAELAKFTMTSYFPIAAREVEKEPKSKIQFICVSPKATKTNLVHHNFWIIEKLREKFIYEKASKSGLLVAFAALSNFSESQTEFPILINSFSKTISKDAFNSEKLLEMRKLWLLSQNWSRIGLDNTDLDMHN
ncbi:MAG: hypothetical protein MHPSP_000420 [Paramarteilia canceri]